MKTKLNFFLEGKDSWIAEEPAEYMRTLTRKQASIIFKARTRMTKIKGNYKNEFPDQMCRACKSNPETHLHALNECETLHPYASTSTDIDYLFCSDTETLQNVATKIDKICEKLNEM